MELQNNAEMGSLVAKNTAQNALVVLDNEDGLPPQIDCCVVVILIGPILIQLDVLNIIMRNLILQKLHLISIIF